MSLRIEVVTTADGLSQIETPWNALSGDNPFLGWDWMSVWWRHYQTPQTQLWVLAAKDDQNQIVGLAPFVLRNSLRRGRVVRFIGSNEVCGDRLTILACDDQRPAVLQAIVNWLTADARQEWDLIELIGAESADTNVAELCRMMADAGHQTHVRGDLNCWEIALPQSWDAYLASLSHGRRSKVRRWIKKFYYLGGCEKTALSCHDLQTGFQVLVDLHQKRRNMLGEPGCFSSERYYAFHEELTQRLCNQGRLRISWIEIGGRPAAVDYNLLGGKTVFNYQSGFDPAFFNEHPGKVKLLLSLQWAMEAGYQSFDMLRGDEPYKADFGGKPTALAQTRIVGQHHKARLRHAAWCTQATVKRWARTGLKRACELRRLTDKTPTQPLPVSK